jgi:glycosyltransferase involved in cell wall biosynthesis
MNPAVSVVTATYNYGQYIGSAVESVLRQTISAFELIVIDDGSTDGTKDVLRPFLADPRVRYLCAGHQGQASSKNRGVELARAPLVAFLDADDLWLPAKLERQMELFSADPDLGVVYGRRLLIDAQGCQLAYEQPELHRGAVLERLFQNNFICFSSSVVRRDVFKEVGGFDTSLALAVDYDFWLRVATRYRFDYVNEPLVKYRTGHASLSRRTEERLFTVLGIMQRFLNRQSGCAALSPEVIRRAQAETYYHIALTQRARSRRAALPWYIRALARSPVYLPAWQGLASLPLPEAVRRCLRRVFGKPVDWSVRPPLASGQSAPTT